VSAGCGSSSPRGRESAAKGRFGGVAELHGPARRVLDVTEPCTRPEPLRGPDHFDAPPVSRLHGCCNTTCVAFGTKEGRWTSSFSD
jgi:hypothetical protein